MLIRGVTSGTARLFLVALLVMGCATVSHRAQAQGEKTAAIVNGEIITEGEFFDRLQRLHGQSFIVQSNPNQAPQIRSETAGMIVMESMITERLTLQAANKANVALSDTETLTELANLKKQPNIQAGLTNHLYTEEMLKHDIRVQGARFNLATTGVKVTPEDVEAYYKAHVADYTVPEQWGVSIILTNNVNTLAKIDADLKAGKSFADTAKLYSDDVSTRDKGGDSGTIFANDTRVPAAIRDAIKLIKPGEITPPVKLEQNRGAGSPLVVTWWRILLRSREPETVRPLNEIRSGVERLAKIEKAGGYQIGDKKIVDLRNSSEIKISLPGYESLETKH